MIRRSLALALAAIIVLICFGAAIAQAPTSGTINSRANVRSGPGTDNAIVGSLAAGESIIITACNDDCTWYQIGEDQWVAAFLVTPATIATATSMPSAAPSETLTDAELAYAQFVLQAVETYRLALSTLGAQFIAASTNSMLLVSPDWKATTNTAITLIQSTDQNVLARATPSARFAALHTELIGVATNYDKAMELVTEGITSFDGGKLLEAQTYMDAGGEALQRASDEAAKVVSQVTPAQTAPATAALLCAQASAGGNLRVGPGTTYAIAGRAQPDQCLTITGRTEAGDWYQLDTGNWLAAFLVDNAPPLASIAVVTVAVPIAAPSDTPVVAATQAPVEEAPAATSTPMPPTATPLPPTATPTLQAGPSCDANYTGACIPVVGYDLDCPDVGVKDFNSVGSDPHGFDRDHDGIACES